MNTQVLQRWEPDPLIPHHVEITAIRDDDDGLVVSLADEASRKPVAQLVFRTFVAYRNINESFRTKTWASLPAGQSTGLFKLENSSWLKWLQAESSGVLDEFQVSHYAIYTNDDCLDIISHTPPTVLRS